MRNLKSHVKKIIAITAAILTASVIMVSSATGQRQGGGQNLTNMYLAYIARFTYATAQATYYIEQFTYGMLTILNGLILPDKSDSTAGLQSSFVTVTNTALQNATTQADLQNQLTQDFFAISKAPLYPVEKYDDKLYANDYTYQSLLGKLYVSPDPRVKKGEQVDIPYNYMKNVAGLNIVHRVPNANWGGNDQDKTNYKNFYTTISAIQTYNTYLLTQLYIDSSNKNALTQQQNALMQQASNSDWFAQVASENIGIIFRQILMYNSQLYVLMTQLLQVQKQLLSAQAMTNTLLILGNQFTETQLFTKASGSLS